MTKAEEREELLEEHERLKEMPVRLNLACASAKDIMDYYRAFYKHIDKVKDYICKDTKGNLDSFVYSQDFWWLHNSKTPLRYSTVRRIGMDANTVIFSDVYVELLLQCLHRIIETGEVEYIVYADIQHGEFVGYKTYEKIDGTWREMSYTKPVRLA